MTDWGDLGARACGLSTRLLDRADLERLARSPHSARDSERTVRRSIAERLELLVRWAGPRTAPLEVVFADEERRSVRALVRGAAHGATARERLRGLVPTPGLGEAALEEAAARRTIEGVVRVLEGHDLPWGRALLERIEAGPFDLFQLEIEIDRIRARRIRSAAREGDDRLRLHVHRTIDLDNAWSVLLAGSFRGEAGADETWIEGGASLDRDRFGALLAEPDPVERREGLAAAFSGTPLGRAFGDSSIPGSGLESAVLRARIEETRRTARRDPLSTAPILLYALRLRAETVDLSRVAWGVALESPRHALFDELVTAR